MPNATELNWLPIADQTVTVDGTAEGSLGLANPEIFKVGMQVLVSSSVVAAETYKVNRITDTEVILGAPGHNIHNRADLSLLLVADTAVISALDQTRQSPANDKILQAVFDAEPVLALRSLLVDEKGNELGSDANPLPVQFPMGTSIDTDVSLTHLDDFPMVGDVADSVRLGDGTTTVKVDAQNQSLSVNRFEKLLALVSNNNWLGDVNFEAINPIFLGDVATLEYSRAGSIVARVISTFVTDSNWSFVFESYINSSDGLILLAEDDTELFLG